MTSYAVSWTSKTVQSWVTSHAFEQQPLLFSLFEWPPTWCLELHLYTHQKEFFIPICKSCSSDHPRGILNFIGSLRLIRSSFWSLSTTSIVLLTSDLLRLSNSSNNPRCVSCSSDHPRGILNYTGSTSLNTKLNLKACFSDNFGCFSDLWICLSDHPRGILLFIG